MDKLNYFWLIMAFIYAVITIRLSYKSKDIDDVNYFMLGLGFALPSGLLIFWGFFKVLVKEALK